MGLLPAPLISPILGALCDRGFQLRSRLFDRRFATAICQVRLVRLCHGARLSSWSSVHA
jgi:hypothetical protein